jgi:nucleotide-binding universal stress UspA family protein
MMDHMLLPLDGSPLAECVLPHAVALARAFSAELTLLHVLARPTGEEQAPMDTVGWHLRRTEAETYLREVAGRLEALGLTVKTMVLEGSAADRIVELADAGSVDLIVLSTHGRSGLSRWSISGVVQEIMVRVNVSTVIVRSHQICPVDLAGLTYRRLLVPLDGSARAQAALQAAAPLARFHGSQLVLAHAVKRPDTVQPLRDGPDDRELVDRLVAHQLDEAHHYLEQVQARLSVPVEIQLRETRNVTATLQRMATRANVDLVVLSAHGHSGEARYPYGSVALNFIVYGTTPLLIIQDMRETELHQIEAESGTAQPASH